MNDNEVNNPLPDDVEALIDEKRSMALFGIFWAAMQPLAFSWLIPIATTGTYSKVAREAIQALDRRFNTSEGVRRKMLERAFNIGATYHEYGNTRTIWNLGKTVQ